MALGGLSFIITLLLSVGAGYALVSIGLARNLLMIALILSTASLGVVLLVLKERGLSSGRYGQTLLVASLTADFATMLLITVLVALLSEGLTLDILLIGLLFVAFFIMYRFGSIFFNQLPPVRRVIEELSHATAQIKIRAAFTMMLIIVVLSEVLGAEVILGAFLAGAIVSLLRTPQDEELGHQRVGQCGHHFGGDCDCHLRPPIFFRILPKTEEVEQRPVVVVSAGPLGLQVAENLRAHNEMVIVIYTDQEHLERARRMGFEVHVSEGGLGSPEVAGCLDMVKSVVCTYNDTEKNYRACEQARSLYGIDHVVAYVADPSLLPRFEQIGVKTMNAAMDHPALLGVLTRNPGVYDMLTRTNSGKEICEVVVRKSEYSGRLIRDLELPGDVLILALSRDGELVVPHGGTRLNEGDRLTLVGSHECTDAVRQFVNPFDYASIMEL